LELLEARDEPAYERAAHAAEHGPASASISTAFQRLPELASSCGYSSRELARAIGITQRHLQRLFAAKIGCTPRTWLNEQRLLAARQMLCTARAVKEVAHSLGFPTVSQFSRDFRSHFGVRPSSLIGGRMP
jgi:transcriptional regulator GlxA family with amidase domain